jgi:DNA-binding GntR family transcriptional regulator
MKAEVEFLFAPVEVDAPSVLEVSYRRLRSAIMSGAFAPGEHLRQEDVARRLGISRGPAREALNRLAAEGLVRLRPRRGYVVEALDIEEVEDIFELRMLLEERASVIATQKRTSQDVEALEQILRDLDALDMQDGNDIARFSELNRLFHSRLFEVSGRKHLCRLLSQLRDSVERYVRFSVSPDTRKSEPYISGDHRRIFEAFRDGDAAAAGAISREHCQKVHRLILKKFETEAR